MCPIFGWHLSLLCDQYRADISHCYVPSIGLISLTLMCPILGWYLSPLCAQYWADISHPYVPNIGLISLTVMSQVLGWYLSPLCAQYWADISHRYVPNIGLIFLTVMCLWLLMAKHVSDVDDTTQSLLANDLGITANWNWCWGMSALGSVSF